MPGWYIHMEAARYAAERLRAGHTPHDFPPGVDAHNLGEIAHKWRNYLALGAVGPDIAALFPDFKPPVGSVLSTFLHWYIDVFDVFDQKFMEPWEKYAEPALTGEGDILNAATGDVMSEISGALLTLAAALRDAILDVFAMSYDWFGLLQSGVPQGVDESAYTWFDMFHYRKPYAFAQALLQNAANHPKHEQFTAFALGWIAHCATDVAAHPFVNAKCGGPYRLHWQRHHLIENHMDSLVYDSQHHGAEPYGEMDTAALHFRLAFRRRDDAPYNGADDAPAYDYFTGQSGPNYSSADQPTANNDRKALWDLDTGDLSHELCDFMIETMNAVYVQGVGPRDTPQILTEAPQQFHFHNTGIPSAASLRDTFFVLYHYLKLSSTSGYSPRKPTPPDLFNEHPAPTPPGFESHVVDDPQRGADLGGNDALTLMDIFAWVIGVITYVIEWAIYIATLPIDYLTDLATYPIRELLYYFFVVPAYTLYLAARQPLVMTGFLHPKPEEISTGLVQLGFKAEGPLTNILNDLQQPLEQLIHAAGISTGSPSSAGFDEPSGRVSATASYGADPAYPRQVIRDEYPLVHQIFGDDVPPPLDGKINTEFLRPWKYPSSNVAGHRNGWEAQLSHPGPFVQGQDATVVMGHAPGSVTARHDFEHAKSPDDTETVSSHHFPKNEHLGDAIDYSVYLIGRMSHGDPVPGFNLDGDRGYGYQTWEWSRDPMAPDQRPPLFPGGTAHPSDKFDFKPPCTAPEGYVITSSYDPNLHLDVHYGVDIGPDPPCAPTTVTQNEIDRAGMPPQG
jgi:hypothetical protein